MYSRIVIVSWERSTNGSQPAVQSSDGSFAIYQYCQLNCLRNLATICAAGLPSESRFPLFGAFALARITWSIRDIRSYICSTARLDVKCGAGKFALLALPWLAFCWLSPRVIALIPTGAIGVDLTVISVGAVVLTIGNPCSPIWSNIV